jgi:hypothetical protein
MAERAKVSDVEILKDLKIALVKFAEEIRSTLSGVDSEVQRVGQWLTHDRPSHWKHEIRRREDKVQHAKAAIATKQLARAPDPVSVAQERKDLQKAQRFLDEGQLRAAAVKRWAPVWDREAQLYKSSCSGLGETLERDVPQGVARLERMLKALEDYLRITGIETADQLAAGLDAPVAADSPDVVHRYAALRQHIPGHELRAGLTPAPVSDLRWAGGEISESEGVTLTRLSISGSPPLPTDKIVIAWRTLEVTSFMLARLEPTPDAPGDSGWYLGPFDRPEATGGLRATTIGSLLSQLPWLAPALSLTPHALVVVKAGVVDAVLDKIDRDAWAAPSWM